MGATTFYALPYPDATSTVDIPRDIKALADKLELWKNGFTVPAGDISVGLNTDTALRYVWTRKKSASNADTFDYGIGVADGYGVVLLRKNSSEINRIMMSDDGSVQTRFGGQYRPVPFAIQSGLVSVANLAAGNGLSAGVTYVANRFTQVPIVTTNCASNTYCVSRSSSGTVSGITLGAYNAGTVASSGGVDIHFHAIQMLPGAASGLREAEPLGDPNVVVTCHVDGCPNDGVAIPMWTEPDVELFYCGGCSQQITDVV